MWILHFFYLKNISIGPKTVVWKSSLPETFDSVSFFHPAITALPLPSPIDPNSLHIRPPPSLTPSFRLNLAFRRHLSPVLPASLNTTHLSLLSIWTSSIVSSDSVSLLLISCRSLPFIFPLSCPPSSSHLQFSTRSVSQEVYFLGFSKGRRCCFTQSCTYKQKNLSMQFPEGCSDLLIIIADETFPRSSPHGVSSSLSYKETHIPTNTNSHKEAEVSVHTERTPGIYRLCRVLLALLGSDVLQNYRFTPRNSMSVTTVILVRLQTNWPTKLNTN